MNARAVGLTRDLPAGRVMRAMADGKDMVVWRAMDGTIAAWDNRCPHRGMALSHGFVRGNRLACLYHGWHYDGTGRCSLIPAHPDLDPPATIHATRYGITELGGVVWVSAEGHPEAQDPDLAPLRSLIFDAGEEVVHAASQSTACGDDMPRKAKDGAILLGRDRLCLLCNPLDEGRTQVTVLVSRGLEPGRLRALSRWCEALRRKAEQEAGS